MWWAANIVSWMWPLFYVRWYLMFFSYKRTLSQRDCLARSWGIGPGERVSENMKLFRAAERIARSHWDFFLRSAHFLRHHTLGGCSAVPVCLSWNTEAFQLLRKQGTFSVTASGRCGAELILYQLLVIFSLDATKEQSLESSHRANFALQSRNPKSIHYHHHFVHLSLLRAS